MGVIVRQGSKATIVSYIGTVIGALITVFVYPYFLTPEQVGLTRIVLDSAIFFSFFAQMGISNAIIRYHSLFKDGDEKKQFFWFISLFPLVSFITFTLIFLIFKNQFISLFAAKSPLFSKYVLYVIPIAFLMMYQSIYESYSSTQLRITIPKVIREIVIRVLMIAAIVVFAVYALQVSIYLKLISVIYVIVVVLLIVYLTTGLKTPVLPLMIPSTKNPVMRKMMGFMMYMLIGGIGSNVISRVDVFMISAMKGLAQTGIYTIAFFIAAVIEIPFRSAVQISGPILSEALAKDDIKKVEDIFKRNTITQAVIAGFILVLVLINVDNVFSIMPNGKLYSGGRFVIYFICLAKLVDVVTGLNNQIILYSKYYKTSLIWIIGLGFLTVMFNYLFIPIWGITGAAVAALISIVSINFIVIGFIYFKMKIQPFTAACLKPLIVYGICFGIHFLIPRINNPYFDLIVRSAVISVCYISLSYFLKISQDINQLIRSMTSVSELKKLIKGE